MKVCVVLTAAEGKVEFYALKDRKIKGPSITSNPLGRTRAGWGGSSTILNIFLNSK